jgi:hypothetical protein
VCGIFSVNILTVRGLLLESCLHGEQGVCRVPVYLQLSVLYRQPAPLLTHLLIHIAKSGSISCPTTTSSTPTIQNGGSTCVCGTTVTAGCPMERRCGLARVMPPWHFESSQCKGGMTRVEMNGSVTCSARVQAIGLGEQEWVGTCSLSTPRQCLNDRPRQFAEGIRQKVRPVCW